MLWWMQPKYKGYDAIICDGSIRSGKSISMTVGFILWSMCCFSDQKFAICGKTVESLRRNIVLNVRDWMPYDFEITEKKAENKLIISIEGRTNQYFLFGGRDESSYMLVQGITLAGALLDEVALMPRSFVEQVCARCSVPGSKLWFNCNPAGPEHWFYKTWILKCKEQNALHLHFTMADNLALSPEIRARYERMFTGVFYRRYVLGEWCVAEGLVYGCFDKDAHVVSDLPQSGRYFISVDYGTMNPFSAGLWCISDGVAYRIKEYYYNGRETGKQLTDAEYYAELEKLADGHNIERIVIDPSAASMIALIRKKHRFTVRKAVNDVIPGINTVAEMLKDGRIKIGSDCKDAIREFGLYSWDSKRTDKDCVIKENDHAMDDIRYFAMTIMSKRSSTEEYKSLWAMR